MHETRYGGTCRFKEARSVWSTHRVWGARAHAVAYQAARSWRPKPISVPDKSRESNQDHRRKVGVQSLTPYLSNQLSICPNRRRCEDLRDPVPQCPQCPGTSRWTPDDLRVGLMEHAYPSRQFDSIDGILNHSRASSSSNPSNLLHYLTTHFGSLSATRGGLEWLLRSAAPSPGYLLWQATVCLSPPTAETRPLVGRYS